MGSDSSNVRAKGFCSGLLRRADMRQNVLTSLKSEFAHICAMKQSGTKSLGTDIGMIGTIPKNMLTNFELKRLKLKLDIVKNPESCEN